MKLTNFRNKTQKVYPYLFALFCFSIPFSQFSKATPNLTVIPVLLAFFLIIDKQSIREKIDLKFILFLTFSVWIFIEALIFNRQDDIKYAERLVSVPFLVMLSFPLINKKPALLAFLVGAIMLMLTSYFRILIFVLSSGGFDFSVGNTIDHILIGDRPYVGFVYVISILLSIYFVRINQYKKYKILFLCIAFLFFLLILIISARLSLLSLIIIGVFSFFFIKSLKIPILISIFLILTVFLLIKFNSNFVNRFYAGFEEKDHSIEKMLILEPRYHIWSCVDRIANEKPIFFKGIGLENTNSELVECYKTHDKFIDEEHRQYFIDSHFNTHNQFMNFYLGVGIVPTALFAVFFALGFKESRKYYTAFSLLMALLLFCLVENVLVRQMGCFLFGFVWILNEYIIRKQQDNLL